MQKRTISIRTLSIVAFITLILLVAPLLISSIYNRPANDDLVQPYAVKVAYDETGSVLQALVVSIRETIRIWKVHNGIFSSMFLSIFAPYVFHYKLGFSHPILITILLIWGCYQLVKCLRFIAKDIPSGYILLISSVLSLMLLTVMPDLIQGFFWYSGAINYTFFFALSLLLYASVLQTTFGTELPKWKQLLRTIIHCIGFFLLGAANWITPTTTIVLYGFLALFLLYQKKPLIHLLPLLFLIAGFALALIAPGNSVRQGVVGDQPSIVEAFILSFTSALEFCLSDGTFYLFPILLLPIFARLSQYMPQLPKCFWLIPIGSVCVFAAGFFPMLYTSYPLQPRHDDMLFFIFAVLLLVNELLLVCWITQRLSATYQKGDHFLLSKTAAFIAGMVLLVLSAFNTSFSLSPMRVTSDYMPVKATIHLLMGYTKNYATSYDALVYRLQTTDETQVMIENDLTSPVIGNPGLLWMEDHWANTGFVDFYTDKEITLRTRY